VIIAEQPRHQIGRLAARMLIERVEGICDGLPREVVLPVRIRKLGPDTGPVNR
jgi:DNA-binding LacI/PurR family transcriptional regulator